MLVKYGISAADLTPLTIKLPICLKFRGDGPETMTGNNCRRNAVTGQITDCSVGNMTYDKDDFVNDMNEAARRWNCICGRENDPCGCEIEIGFSDDYDDFGEAELEATSSSLEEFIRDHASVESPAIWGPAEQPPFGKCEVACEQMVINLNNTAAYRRKRSWISSSFSDNHWQAKYPSGDRVNSDMNLIGGIQRELGRLMNASGSWWDKRVTGTSASTCTCDDEETARYWWESGRYGNEVTPPIPDCEKCMAQKLCSLYPSSSAKHEHDDAGNDALGVLWSSAGWLTIAVSRGLRGVDELILYNSAGEAIARSPAANGRSTTFQDVHLVEGFYIVAAVNGGKLYASAPVVVSR
ncbi:MAG TPA: hypothetical protein VNA88_16570 [Candidatus Kapabacteria bacterium]|jgi:hypothetical protein|nr:hypothetical protein [Candidatus Kapabacteria bacterium]